MDINESSVDKEKLLEKLKFLKVSFKEIDKNKYDGELLHDVYHNSLYEINFNNIFLLLSKEYGIHENEIRHRNFSSIHSLALDINNFGLTIYMVYVYNIKNADAYIKMVLENCEDEITDDEVAVIQLMNVEEISKDNKIAYIGYLATVINDITTISDKALWIHLLSRKAVAYTANNMLEYFVYKRELDDTIISYLNDELETSYTDVVSNYDEEVTVDFFDAIVECKSLNNKNYEIILIKLGCHIVNFEVTNMANDKMKILINNHIIIMNSENLQFLRTNYKDLVMYFIMKNLKSYGEIISTELSEYNEMIELLSMEIEDDYKVKVISWTNNVIPIYGKNYTTEVNSYILKNNIDLDEIEKLFLSFSSWEDSIKDLIYKKAVDLFLDSEEEIEDIIDCSLGLDVELMDRLIENSDIDTINKKKILAAFLPNEKKVCIKYLSILNLNKFINIFDRDSRPLIEINNINEKLLDAFKDKYNDLIEDYIESHKEGYYRIQRPSKEK